MPRPPVLPLAVELAVLARDQRRSEYLERVTDVPASLPARPLPLVAAGVASQAIELSIAQLIDGPAHLSGSVHLHTPLSSSRRGVHMSRFVEVVAALMGEEWETIEAALDHGVRLAADEQDTDEATLEFAGRTIIWRDAPITGRQSPDPLHIFAKAHYRDGRTVLRLGLRASVMTACPCTLAFSHHSARLDLADTHGDDLATAVMDGVLTYTHSQRAEVDVEIEPSDGFALPNCLAALEQATTVSRELLKRPDEHAVVRAAHLKPQFTEDVVREVATTLALNAPAVAADSSIRVEARAIESIHAHDVCARFEGTICEVIEAVNA